MTAPRWVRVPTGALTCALLLWLAACGSTPGVLPPAPAPIPLASKPQAPKGPRAPSLDIALALHIPPSITLRRAQVRDPKDVVTTTCHSRSDCERLERWGTSPGRYLVVLDYLSPSGNEASFEARLFAGYGESLIELTFYANQDGELDIAISDIEGAAPIEGVELHEVAPGAPGKLPSLELVNGSNVPIYVRSQDDRALLDIVDRPLGSAVQVYTACGTGTGLTEVAPGAAIPAMRLAAIGGMPPLAGGRYRVLVHYGRNLWQEYTSLGSREVSLDVEVKEAAASTTPAATTTPSDSAEPR